MNIDNYLDIEKWLKKMYIDSYDIHDDLTVDVNGDVFLKGNIKYIPIQFGTVKGEFDCSGLEIKTLKGCPSIVYGTFSCNHNKLASLQYAPEEVGGSFDCSHNKLKTLKGVSAKIGGSLDCSYNLLTSMKYCPTLVRGILDCSYNNLTSFLFLPENIGNGLFIQKNKIIEKELANFNSIVGGEIHTDLNLSTSQFLSRVKETRVLLEKETLLNIVSATESTFKKNKRI